MITHRKNQVGLLMLTLMQIAPIVWAEGQWCQGKVGNLFMNANGEVYAWVSWRSDYVKICNISQDLNSVTPKICASWFSLLQTALITGRNTTIQYSDAPACNTIPTYGGSPTPNYVMLE